MASGVSWTVGMVVGMAGAGQLLTAKKRTLFLDELGRNANVTRAAEVAGITRQRAYQMRDTDPAFAAAWEEALERAADVLEQEARRRAVEGVEEPLTSAKGLIFDAEGNPMMTRKYSDTLLIFLLKGARPEKYRENVRQEVHGGLTVRYENDWRGGHDGGGDESEAG